MSGHNKWSSIKHKKGAADAKRSKIFSKLSKEGKIELQGNHLQKTKGILLEMGFAPDTIIVKQ